uniref:Uncharacterized protein n=1 Tax=Salmo trutta TaxID=8032 RepID=A0A673XLL3_SALTR
VPGSNTSHLTQALVSLPGTSKPLTFHPVTFGDPDDVYHLVLLLLDPVHLLRDGAAVQLHLHDVGLLSFEGHVDENPDGCAVFLHVIKVLLQLLLATLICPLLGILGERLLLALVPGRVYIQESALALVTEVLGEDGLEGPQATDCVDVPNNPHHHHRRSLDDSDSLHRLTQTVHTQASAVHLTQDVGHAGLVAHEGGEVDGLAGVVLGPAAGLPPVLLAALAGQEAHVPMAGRVEFTVRLGGSETDVHINKLLIMLQGL